MHDISVWFYHALVVPKQHLMKDLLSLTDRQLATSFLFPGQYEVILIVTISPSMQPNWASSCARSRQQGSQSVPDGPHEG